MPTFVLYNLVAQNHPMMMVVAQTSGTKISGRDFSFLYSKLFRFRTIKRGLLSISFVATAVTTTTVLGYFERIRPNKKEGNFFGRSRSAIVSLAIV